MIVERPWGRYEVLRAGADCKVKRLTIDPDKQLSWQRHTGRDEHWFVVSGTGTAFIGTVREVRERRQLSAGVCIDVPRNAFHSVRASPLAPLVIIEIQTGDAFDEEDIVRAPFPSSGPAAVG